MAGSYKTETRTSTIGACIGDGISALQDLASEVREIVDNASEGLANTQRIQTLGETADTLEGISEVDVPEAVADLPCTYSEQIPARKGRSASRAVQCGNAVSMIQAGIDGLNDWLTDNDPEHDEGTTEEKEAAQELFDDVQSCVNDAEEAVGSAEGVEFPGMFG